MIKETDLRIGNVIYYQSSEDGLLPNIVDWEDLKWLSENPENFNEIFKPIPISWVTLLKLGWEKHFIYDDNSFTISKRVGPFKFFSLAVDEKGLHFATDFDCIIKYYHQLENIVYLITGFYLDDQLEKLEVSKLANENDYRF